MAILEISRGQEVMIPAITLSNGKRLQGVIKASDGESMVIDLRAGSKGVIPGKIAEMCVLTWESEGTQRNCPILIRSHTPRSIVAQVIIQERRQSPRLRVDMQIIYELVPPNQVAETAEQVMTQLNPQNTYDSEALRVWRDTDDPVSQLRNEIGVLQEMLNEVLGRLDHLTAVVTGSAPAETTRFNRPLGIQNCSSTGVGLIVREGLHEGDSLRLHLTLRTVPQTEIDCMGLVVRCNKLATEAREGGEDRYDVGVQFTHIHESDRERIIQYLFKAQRRLLRDRREAREQLGAGKID